MSDSFTESPYGGVGVVIAFIVIMAIVRLIQRFSDDAVPGLEPPQEVDPSPFGPGRSSVNKTGSLFGCVLMFLGFSPFLFFGAWMVAADQLNRAFAGRPEHPVMLAKEGWAFTASLAAIILELLLLYAYYRWDLRRQRRWAARADGERANWR